MDTNQVMTEEVVSDIDLLAARRYLYGLLWLTLGEEPTFETLETLVSDLAQEAAVMMDSDGGLKASFESLEKAWADLVADEASDALDMVKGQYTKAFVGPGKLAAYPWESMYEKINPGLFMDSTLDVRHFYASQGMQSTHLNAEPDDHIATELHFMMKMSERTLEEGADIPALVQVQADFLDQHLLVWVPDYATALRESGKVPLYSAIADFATAFIEKDRALVNKFM